LLDALNRHRGKSQQKVTVEHVHVHSGGQAIVGAVGPGEGLHRKTRSVPQAQGVSCSQRNTAAGLLASSLDAVSPQQLGTKAGKLTPSSLPVLVPTIATISTV
jgi:hypothetical protein